jgi:hypothetical protein
MVFKPYLVYMKVVVACDELSRVEGGIGNAEGGKTEVEKMGR